GAGEPHRADDTGLLRLFFFVDQAEPVFIAKTDDQSGQVFIGNSTSELAVQGLNRRRPQRGTVNLIERPGQFLRGEESALNLVRVALEPLVRAEAGPRGPAELSADRLLLPDDQLNGGLDKRVVVFLSA